MADSKETDMSIIMNPTYIRCLDSSGNSKNVTPAQLIDFGSSVNMSGSSLNSALKTGFYTATFETADKPVNDYGFVEVLHKGAYILQKFYALNENHLYYRRSINNGESFNSWLQIV